MSKGKPAPGAYCPRAGLKSSLPPPLNLFACCGSGHDVPARTCLARDISARHLVVLMHHPDSLVPPNGDAQELGVLPVPAREAQAPVDEREDSGRKRKAYDDQGDDGQPWILQKSMCRFHTQSSLELRSLHNTRVTLNRKGYESVRYNDE